MAADYPRVAEKAAAELNPSEVANYLVEMTRLYSRYYHDHPVLQQESADLVVSRVELAKAILQVFRNGVRILGVPFVERM